MLRRFLSVPRFRRSTLRLGALVASCAILLIAASPVNAEQASEDTTPATEVQSEAAATAIDPFVLVMPVLAILSLIIFFNRKTRRLPEPSRVVDPFDRTISTLFLCLIFVSQSLGGMIAFGIIRAGKDSPEADAEQALPALTFQEGVIVQTAAYAAAMIWVVVYLIAARRKATREHKTNPLRHVGLAIGIGFSAMLLFFPLVQVTGLFVRILIETLQSTQLDQISHETLSEMVARPADAWFWAQAALAVFGAPIIEEVLYRGLLQRIVRNLGAGPWTAIIATSVVFAFAHVGNSDANAVAALVVLSIGLGWAYEKHGSILVPIAMHLAFNALNLLIATTQT